MAYEIILSKRALKNIAAAVEYYEKQLQGLGKRFAIEVDNALQAIANMPTAYSYRYKQVRDKLVRKFPYLIFFTINEKKQTVTVLSVFHTSQKPFWA